MDPLEGFKKCITLKGVVLKGVGRPEKINFSEVEDAVTTSLE